MHRGDHRAELSVLALRAAGAARAAGDAARAARRAGASAWSSVRTRRRRRGDAAQARRRRRRAWANARTCCRGSRPTASWATLPSVAWLHRRRRCGCRAAPHATDMTALPALALARDDARAASPSPSSLRRDARRRPAPRWKCRAAARITARSARRTTSATIIASGRCRWCSRSSTALIAQGVEYVYFIDEIFLPDRDAARGAGRRGRSRSACRRASISGRRRCSTCSGAPAACRSRRASRASPSEGRNLLDKGSRLTTERDRRAARSTRAQRVPFVQANLLESRRRRSGGGRALARSICSSTASGPTSPCRCFPIPGSPGYAQRWGAPDDGRGSARMDHYLAQFDEFSDIQEARPQPLAGSSCEPTPGCQDRRERELPPRSASAARPAEAAPSGASARRRTASVGADDRGRASAASGGTPSIWRARSPPAASRRTLAVMGPALDRRPARGRAARRPA